MYSFDIITNTFQAQHPSFDCPDQVLLEMLQSLTADLPRPLPPSDLCFLHELYHRGAHMRLSCLQLAAKQALTCASGKRFVENYLTTLENKDIDVSFFKEH